MSKPGNSDLSLGLEIRVSAGLKVRDTVRVMVKLRVRASIGSRVSKFCHTLWVNTASYVSVVLH